MRNSKFFSFLVYEYLLHRILRYGTLQVLRQCCRYRLARKESSISGSSSIYSAPSGFSTEKSDTVTVMKFVLPLALSLGLSGNFALEDRRYLWSRLPRDGLLLLRTALKRLASRRFVQQILLVLGTAFDVAI